MTSNPGESRSIQSQSSAQQRISNLHGQAQRARRGWRPWMLFLVCSLFYFYEFFARVAPGVLQPELMRVTGSSQGEFGLAMGMYFLAYAPSQLLVGRLLDRFGVRAVVAPAAVVVALGCLPFASTNDVVVMGLGRLMQGLGSSVAYLGVIYLAMIWFPPKRHGMVPGLTVAMGTLGASFAQYPLLILTKSWGWRAPLLVCTGAGLIIALMLWKLLPKRPNWFVELMREDGFDPKSPQPLASLIKEIMRDRNIWCLSLAAAGLYLPISVIGDLWGVTFLHIHSGLSTGLSSLLTTLIFIGFAAGGIATGYLSDRLKRRKILFVTGAILSSVIAVAIALTNSAPLWWNAMLMIALGLTTGSQLLAFVMTADVAKRHNRAVKLAFVNFVVMVLPVFIQPAVGFLAQIGVAKGLVPSPGQELQGYGLVVVLMFISTGLSLCVKDTKPRKEKFVIAH